MFVGNKEQCRIVDPQYPPLTLKSNSALSGILYRFFSFLMALLCSRAKWTAWMLPDCAAIWRGVILDLFFSFTFAPSLISSLAIVMRVCWSVENELNKCELASESQDWSLIFSPRKVNTRCKAVFPDPSFAFINSCLPSQVVICFWPSLNIVMASLNCRALRAKCIGAPNLWLLVKISMSGILKRYFANSVCFYFKARTIAVDLSKSVSFRLKLVSSRL